MNSKLLIVLAASVLALSACKNETPEAKQQAAEASAAADQAGNAAADAANAAGNAARQNHVGDLRGCDQKKAEQAQHFA